MESSGLQRLAHRALQIRSCVAQGLLERRVVRRDRVHAQPGRRLRDGRTSGEDMHLLAEGEGARSGGAAGRRAEEE
jgi:hypothetical protein